MSLAEQYPKTVICSALGIPRGRFYARSGSKQKPDETALKAAVSRTAAEWVRYGQRRLCAQLKREGITVGRVKMRRLMQELGIAQKPKAKKIRTTNSEHGFERYPNVVEGLTITHPHQVWVVDITYIWLRTGFVYLAVLMDVYTRQITGWALSPSIDQDLTLAALHKALTGYGAPQIHHSDQGVQYAAERYTKTLLDNNITISMADVGCPEQNGYAERLMRTIKEEHVELVEYRDFLDAKAKIGRFLNDVYMHKRIHSSLGYLTPKEFAAQCEKTLFTTSTDV